MTLNRRDPTAPRAERDVAAIENRQRAVRVQVRPLELFLQRVKDELGLRGDCVAVRLIGDAEMARLNGKYRGEKRTTDVLSFPDEENGSLGCVEIRSESTAGRFWAILRFRRS